MSLLNCLYVGYCSSNIKINRNTKNKPELRQQEIIKSLISNNKDNIVVSHYDERYKGNDKNLHRILANIHDPQMIDFFFDAYNGFKENDFNKDYSLNENGSIGLIPDTFPTRHELDEDIEQLKISLDKWKQVGLYCTDYFTPIYENTLDDILNSVNVVLEMVMRMKCYDYDLVYCIPTNPGHHAGYSFYGGFCFVNTVMITASLLLEHYDNVAICDVDYHAGDGTHSLVRQFNKQTKLYTKYAYKTLTSLSLHINPKYDYPSFRGHKRSDDKDYGIFNFLFEPQCSSEDYFELFDKMINELDKIKPEIIVVAFGADTFKNDPETVAKCLLSIEDYKIMGQKFRNFIQINKSKLFIVQEGGYDLNSVPYIVNNLIDGIMNE